MIDIPISDPLPTKAIAEDHDRWRDLYLQKTGETFIIEEKSWRGTYFAWWGQNAMKAAVLWSEATGQFIALSEVIGQ